MKEKITCLIRSSLFKANIKAYLVEGVSYKRRRIIINIMAAIYPRDTKDSIRTSYRDYRDSVIGTSRSYNYNNNSQGDNISTSSASIFVHIKAKEGDLVPC